MKPLDHQAQLAGSQWSKFSLEATLIYDVVSVIRITQRPQPLREGIHKGSVVQRPLFGRPNLRSRDVDLDRRPLG